MAWFDREQRTITAKTISSTSLLSPTFTIHRLRTSWRSTSELSSCFIASFHLNEDRNCKWYTRQINFSRHFCICKNREVYRRQRKLRAIHVQASTSPFISVWSDRVRPCCRTKIRGVPTEGQIAPRMLARNYRKYIYTSRKERFSIDEWNRAVHGLQELHVCLT